MTRKVCLSQDFLEERELCLRLGKKVDEEQRLLSFSEKHVGEKVASVDMTVTTYAGNQSSSSSSKFFIISKTLLPSIEEDVVGWYILIVKRRDTAKHNVIDSSLPSSSSRHVERI